MNQVEMWLSILVRKLLRRGNFRSADDLRDQVRAFYRLFQSDDGQAIQVDLSGQATLRVTIAGQISAGLY
jgi:hypothetical protein